METIHGPNYRGQCKIRAYFGAAPPPPVSTSAEIRINLPNTELDIIYGAGQCRRLPGEGHCAEFRESLCLVSTQDIKAQNF